MAAEVILPRVDMDMATGRISRWFVAPGAAVTKGQPLFEIETDKVTVDMPALERVAGLLEPGADAARLHGLAHAGHGDEPAHGRTIRRTHSATSSGEGMLPPSRPGDTGMGMSSPATRSTGSSR